MFTDVDKAKSIYDYEKVDRLLEGFEEKHKRESSDIGKVFYLRAQNFELQIEYQKAETYYAKALGIDDQNALYLNDYAVILWKLGRYAEAEPLYRRALEIREEQLGPEHPSVAMSLNNLASLLDAQGKYDEAEPLYRRALQICEQSLGTSHPTTNTIQKNLAGLRENMKEESDRDKR